MKNILIPALIAAGVGAYLWNKKKKADSAKTNTSSGEMPILAIEKADPNPKTPYTSAFKFKYDLVVPPKQAAVAIRTEGFKLQDDRKIREYAKMAAKTPFYL